MRLVIHAVGRRRDVLPYVALGAEVHEANSAEEARQAVVEAAAGEATLVILSEEFSAAAEAAPTGLVFVAPTGAGPARSAVERTREIISRSVGVDLIAKADRTGR